MGAAAELVIVTVWTGDSLPTAVLSKRSEVAEIVGRGGVTPCTANVVFTPTAAGTRSGALSITTNLLSPVLRAALSGIGNLRR